jgi:hypothetical protein
MIQVINMKKECLNKVFGQGKFKQGVWTGAKSL